jgi:hypothetical protein
MSHYGNTYNVFPAIAGINLAQGATGRLEIGYASSVLLSDVFSETIKAFSRKYSNNVISLEEVSSKNQMALQKRGIRYISLLDQDCSQTSCSFLGAANVPHAYNPS